MKYCPNCGAEIAPDDKFCTKCGFVLPVVGQTSGAAKQVRTEQPSQTQATSTSTPAQPNQTVTAVQGYATNYFQWLWDALKKPFNNDESEAFYQHDHGKDGLSLAAHLGLADKAGWDDDYCYPDLVEMLDHNKLFNEMDSDTAADCPQVNRDAGNSSPLNINDDDLPF